MRTDLFKCEAGNTEMVLLTKEVEKNFLHVQMNIFCKNERIYLSSYLVCVLCIISVTSTQQNW